MTDTNRNRVSKGVSTGGQFAPGVKAEAASGLTPTPPGTPSPSPAAALGGFASKEFTGAVSDFREAQDLKEFADAVRSTYPGAVAINPEFGGGDSNVEYIRDDDTRDWVDLYADCELPGEPPVLFSDENNLLHRLAADESHQRVELASIDTAYTEAEQRYTEQLAAALVPAAASKHLRTPVLPEVVPAGHRIITDIDDDGDGRACLIGPDGDPVITTIDVPGREDVHTEVHGGADQWAEDYEDEIGDELRIAAANRRELNDLVAARIGLVPAVGRHLEALATGRHD